VRAQSVLLNLVHVFGLLVGAIVLSASPRSFAAELPVKVQAWLKVHVGDSDDQIAPLVLQRARALYLRKVAEGAVGNACYFAMDATRPSDSRHGGLGRRFYILCESKRSFRAVSAGHGSGRRLRGVADFANGRRCAKNFGNALGSNLTAGGAYVTAETKESFKGYYRVSGKRNAAFIRPFVQFDGEGETANARERAIGGHAAVLLQGECRLKDPDSRYASEDGYVPLGRLVEYAGGRSSGCTSWSPSVAREIVAMTRDDPTTLYIYPEAADVNAVARAVAGGRSLSRAGLYWNASCLKEIGSPRYWPKERVEPILAQYKRESPARLRPPLPICKGQ
jgi:hypothetical protein